jgi:hypothetical protein
LRQDELHAPSQLPARLRTLAVGHFGEENIVLREVTVQSRKLLCPQEILFARKMRSQLFRDVPVQGRQILVRRIRCRLEQPFDPEMVLIHHFDA